MASRKRSDTRSGDRSGARVEVGADLAHERSLGRHEQRIADRAGRREAYLDAAIAVIHREGPQASMDAIAHAAGVSKPILYRHFGDREGLVAAVAERFGSTITSRIEAALSQDASAPRLLRDAIDAYVRTIEEDPSLYRYVTRRSLATGPALTDMVDRIAASVARLLGERMRSAGLDSGMVGSWSYGIVGMVHLAGDQWAAHPSIPRERLIDELVALLWSGLSAVGPPVATALATSPASTSTESPASTADHG